jgi:4-hydroxy 2-oxovalerate aldolase
MKHIKVLDCTLRDGGYVNDFNFGREVIKGIISRLVKSNLDIIECGFLKDVIHQEEYSIFSEVKDIEQYMPKDRKNISFVAMIDYGRYDLTKLAEFDGKTIDGIRDCFFKKDCFDAIEGAKEIISKGYNVYIQPVDILGYTDAELLELIERVNCINPYAFSVVDTFGSMSNDDLVRIFGLLDHNLNKEINIGFHSHNNMQLSFALSQKIAEISQGKRQIIIDCTVLGLGRGAGNTPTELVLHYLNTKWDGYDYNLNELLDLIDIYMLPIQKKYIWGYNIPNYIAGIYSSHVHNVTYLMDKHNIHAKDMRIIIESIEPLVRKRYDYDNLEMLYVNYVTNKIDDTETIKHLTDDLGNKVVLVLAPGKTLETHKHIIEKFIQKNDVIVISANFISFDYKVDFAFFSNQKRLESNIEFRNNKLQKTKLILTSNIKIENFALKTSHINYDTLIKRKKWKYFDNATILLLRLLNILNVKKIFLAGVDGFSSSDNYALNNEFLDANISKDEIIIINTEMIDMFKDIMAASSRNDFIEFITPSLYEVYHD